MSSPDSCEDISADITSSGKDISPVLSGMLTGASLARKVKPKETGNVRRTLWAWVRVGVRGAAGKLWVRRWLVLGGSWQVAWWTIRRRQDVRPEIGRASCRERVSSVV